MYGRMPNTYGFGPASTVAVALFAMGRTIGWIGHALEQYQIDRMIRPRARYVGVQPAEIPDLGD